MPGPWAGGAGGLFKSEPSDHRGLGMPALWGRTGIIGVCLSPLRGAHLAGSSGDGAERGGCDGQAEQPESRVRYARAIDTLRASIWLPT